MDNIREELEDVLYQMVDACAELCGLFDDCPELGEEYAHVMNLLDAASDSIQEAILKMTE